MNTAAVRAVSEAPLTFHAFARLFRDTLGCRDALYLDGTLSKMYRKGGSVPWQYHPFVTIITVERK